MHLAVGYLIGHERLTVGYFTGHERLAGASYDEKGGEENEIKGYRTY